MYSFGVGIENVTVNVCVVLLLRDTVYVSTFPDDEVFVMLVMETPVSPVAPFHSYHEYSELFTGADDDVPA